MPHVNTERVQAALVAQGVNTQVVELEDSTHTAAEAAAALGVLVAQIAKSLIFLVDEAPLLVIASGINRVDVEKLAHHVGVERQAIRQASANAVKRLTGFTIGGVAPLAHATPLRTMLDRDLLQYADIWASAGTAHAVFRITGPELQRITGADVIDIREEPAHA